MTTSEIEVNDQELIDLGIKVVTSTHNEWEERRQRWNQFSEDEIEAPVRIIVVPLNINDVVTIVNWARKYHQTDIGVRSGGKSLTYILCFSSGRRLGFRVYTVFVCLFGSSSLFLELLLTLLSFSCSYVLSLI